MRIVVLIDGEHYPAVVRHAIAAIASRGDEVVAAVFCGGSEKIREGDLDSAYGVPVEHGRPVDELLAAVLERHQPDAVVDLADEPVVSSADRFRIASPILFAGARYIGPDFELRPPELEPVFSKPAIRVIATGKRTGKTATAGALARHAVSRGHNPAIIAMGRGGPGSVEVVEGGERLGPRELVALADEGRHAASDYLEDAVTSRVTTIGCRRVGGGLAGAVFDSNVVDAARVAEDRPEDLVILEGSGAGIPPVSAHAGLICVPAGAPPALLSDHIGPYRFLLSDLAVVTMAEDEAAAALVESTVREVAPRIRVVRVVLRPRPLSEVAGHRVFFCCAAPPQAAPVLKRHLEEVHGCEVVGMTHALGDRASLQKHVREAAPHDIVLTELKGAAVDLVARSALERGSQVVFVDNELVGEGVLDAFDWLMQLARARAETDEPED